MVELLQGAIYFFCVCEFFTLNTIRLEVETENNILKMWSNFDPIPRNSNPGTFSLLKP